MGCLKFVIIGTPFIMTKKTSNPILLKKAYPPFLIDKVIKKYHDYKFSRNQNQLKGKSDVHFSILPYISNLSHQIKNEFTKVLQRKF